MAAPDSKSRAPEWKPWHYTAAAIALAIALPLTSDISEWWVWTGSAGFLLMAVYFATFQTQEQEAAPCESLGKKLAFACGTTGFGLAMVSGFVVIAQSLARKIGF